MKPVQIRSFFLSLISYCGLPMVKIQKYSVFSKDAATKISQNLSEFSNGMNREQNLFYPSLTIFMVFLKILNVKTINLT